MRLPAAILFVVCSASAGEYAVLANGFRLYANSHEVSDGTVRLHTSTGTVEMPVKDVVHFEVEEYVRPAVAPIPEQPKVEVPVLQAVIPPSPEQLVKEAADLHGLRPEFVRSVASVESAWRTNAVSYKGAIGLMQLMPGTAKDLGANPHDPAQNAEAGTRYLKQLLLKYANTPDPVRYALAAYNAGPGAVDRYGTVPPYRETQQYVEKVLRRYLSELKASAAPASRT